MNSKFIQIKEASEMLGVSKLTLRNWDKKGKLITYRHPINNYRIYKTEDIHRLLENLKSTKNFCDEIPAPPEKLTGPKTYTLKVIHVRD